MKIKDIGTYNPLMIPNSGIITNSRQTKPIGRFFFLNNDGLIKDVKGDYPAFGMELNNMEKTNAFECVSDVRPDFSKVVLAYKETDLLEIYDTQGNLIHRIHGPDHFFPHIKMVKVEDGASIFRQETGKAEGTYRAAPTSSTRDAFMVVKAGSDEIWALYADGRKPSRDYHHSTLLVFDWEGNPLRRYKLDKPIFYFDLDWNNKTIFGLSHNPKSSIFKYKF